MCRVLVLQGVEWGLRERIHILAILFCDKLSPSRTEPERRAGTKARRKKGGAWGSERRSRKESKVGDTFWVSPGVLREDRMTCPCVTMQARINRGEGGGGGMLTILCV